MAQMTIMLRRDPVTGRQNIIVKLDSDPDALPHEHEQLHRALVEKLIGKGIVQAEELGEIVVEREESAPLAEETRGAEPLAQPQANAQGH
jgi:mannitol/fructose-specific phosphotransferase system IIA component (Ntr-type)